MQAVKLIIEGTYWDSMIYSGRLYLFDRVGAVHTVDWDRLVSGFPISEELRLAMQCAFSRSDYFYGQHWKPLFTDHEVMQLIQSKFTRLASHTLSLGVGEVRRNMVSVQDSPFPFPHSDSRIYGKKLFVSSQSGVFHAGCSKRLANGVSTRVVRRWDCPVLSLAAYSNTLAMAAGDEGLFETRVGETSWSYPEEEEVADERNVRNVAKDHCESCEWTFLSIFGSSHANDGFLAKYDTQATNGSVDGPPHRTDPSLLGFSGEKTLKRSFSRVVSSKSIFKGHGYSWANRDKIYQAGNGQVRVRKYQPWQDKASLVFSDVGSLKLAPWKGEIISAGVAVFGTVIECENAIVVVLSDGTAVTISGEPVRWRVFPRSRHYENQLHVIYDDRLEIWSFNQDYFVDQREKKAGIEPSESLEQHRQRSF